uniref:Uncharacterized protein n=1 Tax=Ditylenchus dipsaci TaxID=166011 RepID=A0A915D5U3_9BILA
MTDCLLINSLFRSIRTQVVSTTGNRPKSHKEKSESTSSSRNSSLNTTPTTTTTALNIRRNGDPSMETTDQAPFPLPEMLTDFKSQLCQLQEAMKKDFEEIERLRLENESMRHQLAERDQLIHSLQLQMQQLLQTHTNHANPNAEDT